MGAQIKSLARLVEADVAVVADAQQLQIHAAHAADDLIVVLALGLGIQIGAVRQVDVCGIDVHMVEQVAVHKAPVAFRVLLGQAAVLVQIDGGDLRKIQISLVVALHQLLVCAHGGAAGSQTQHAVGLHDDLCGNDVCCLAGHIGVVLCTNDLHDKRPLILHLLFVGRAQRYTPASGSSLSHLPTESHKTAQFFRFSVSFGKSALKRGWNTVLLHKGCARGVSLQTRPSAGR